LQNICKIYSKIQNMNKTMQKTAPTQSEAKIQQKIVMWYRTTYCLSHHYPRSIIISIPNESNGVRAMKLIQTGMYGGCADLLICHVTGITHLYRHQWIFVEVKTETGVQSPSQKLFEAHCKQSGIRYKLVRSLEEFKEILQDS
jgi:hypothetical protein